jgi:hypothetical protein
VEGALVCSAQGHHTHIDQQATGKVFADAMTMVCGGVGLRMSKDYAKIMQSLCKKIMQSLCKEIMQSRNILSQKNRKIARER